MVSKFQLKTVFADGRETWEFNSIPWKAEIINVNLEDRILDMGMRMSLTFLADETMKDMSIRKYLVLPKNAIYEGKDSLQFLQRINGNRGEVLYVFQIGVDKIIKAEVPKEEKETKVKEK